MENNLRKTHFKYLNYVFDSTYAVKSKHYPDSTFFKKGDKVILELEKSGILWVLYSVWCNISNMFSFDYKETQQLIKEWVEEQLKLGEVTPEGLLGTYNFLVEEQLKLGEVTPVEFFTGERLEVEEQLKLGEITPKQAVFPIEYPEEITPEESIPLQSWRDLENKEIKPVKFYENELQVLEEQLKQEILKLSKDEKK